MTVVMFLLLWFRIIINTTRHIVQLPSTIRQQTDCKFIVYNYFLYSIIVIIDVGLYAQTFESCTN